jgi:NAD(P)-dependent dehydrogenase (short-subunit alcohol dehydrogenase family)
MSVRGERFVLITGTSRGIGRATALRLASAGISVIAGVRNPDDGARLERDAQGRLSSIILDVGDDESIEHACGTVREIVRDHGLFGLVNNAAATGSGSPLAYVTRRDLEAAFRVTAFGAVLTTRAMLPLLEATGGRVVNVGAGRLAMPLLGTTYGAKFALEAMTDVLRVELRRAGVHVSIVEPGMTRWEDPERQLVAYGRALDEGLRSVPAETRVRYEPAVRRFKALQRRMLARAASAESVAVVIHRALSAIRPKARYYCGWGQTVVAVLERFATARMRDAIVGATLDL